MMGDAAKVYKEKDKNLREIVLLWITKAGYYSNARLCAREFQKSAIIIITTVGQVTKLQKKSKKTNITN